MKILSLIFISFTIKLAIQQEYTQVYIDSSAAILNQDGSRLNPYQNFSYAYMSNITFQMELSPVEIIFNYNSNPYDFTININSDPDKNLDLLFTSNISQALSSAGQCGQFPMLSINTNFFQLNGPYNITFSNLQIISYTQITFQSLSNGALLFESLCWQSQSYKGLFSFEMDQDSNISIVQNFFNASSPFQTFIDVDFEEGGNFMIQNSVFDIQEISSTFTGTVINVLCNSISMSNLTALNLSLMHSSNMNPSITFFNLARLNQASIQNITSSNLPTGDLHICIADSIGNLNFDGLNAIDSFLTFFEVMKFIGSNSSNLVMSNININECSGLVILNSTRYIRSLLISEIFLKYAESFSKLFSLEYYNTTYGTMNELIIQNVFIKNSLRLGSFLSTQITDEQGNIVDYYIPSYMLTLDNITILSSSFQSKEFFIETQGTQIALLNSFINSSSILSGFYHGITPSPNFFMVNTTLLNIIFDTPDIIFLQESVNGLTDPSNTSLDNTILYRVFYFKSCTILGQVGYTFDNSLFEISSPYVLIEGNIFYSLTSDAIGLNFFNISGFSVENYFQYENKNPAIAQVLYSGFPEVLDFTSQLYVANVSGNIIHRKYDVYAAKSLLVYSSAEKIFFHNNIVLGYVTEKLLHINSLSLEPVRISGNIFTEIDGIREILAISTSNLIYENNTVNQINTVHGVSFAATKDGDIYVEFTSNVVIQSQAISHLDVGTPYYLRAEISNNTFIYCQNVQGIDIPNQIITLKATQQASENFIIIKGLKIIAVSMLNTMDLEGFYNPVINSFIYAELIGVQSVNLIDVHLINLYSQGALNSLFTIKAGSIVITDMIVENSNIKNTSGPVCITQGTNLTIINSKFTNYKGRNEPKLIYFDEMSFLQFEITNMQASYIYLDKISVHGWDSEGKTFVNLITPNLFLKLNNIEVDEVWTFITASVGSASLHLEDIKVYGDTIFFLSKSTNVSNAALNITNYYQYKKKNFIHLDSFHFNSIWNFSSVIIQNAEINHPSFFSLRAVEKLLHVSNFKVSSDGNTRFTILSLKSGIDHSIFNFTNITLINFGYQYSFLEVYYTDNPFYNIFVKNMIIINSNFEFIIGLYLRTGYTANISIDGLIALDSDFEFYPSLTEQKSLEGAFSLSNSILINTKANIRYLILIKNINFTNVIITEMKKDLKFAVSTPKPNSNPFILNSLIYTRSSYQISLNYVDLYMNDSVFSQNIDIYEHGGGAIKLESSNISASNSIFYGNVANIGGAIMLMYPSGTTRSFNNVINMSNEAFLYGDFIASAPNSMRANIKFPFKSKRFEQYLIYNISQQMINNNMIINLDLTISNASLILLQNSVLELKIFDIFNQSIVFTNESKIAIYIKSANQRSQIFTPNIQNLSHTIHIPNTNFHISGSGSSNTFSLLIEYNNFTQLVNLQFLLRECLPGEYTDPVSGLCVLCTNNTFSFSNNSACLQCPISARCLGGELLDVYPGYWREANTTDIYSCLDDGVSRCDGGVNLNDQCATGYSGALCLGCNYTGGYSPSSGGVCGSCSENEFWIWVKAMIVILVNYAYEIGYIWFINRSNKKFTMYMQHLNRISKQKSLTSYHLGIEIFILTNFLQFAYIILNYMSYLQNNLMAIIDHLQLLMTISANPSSQQSSNFNCLLLLLGSNPNHVTYNYLLFTILFPFAKVLLTLLFVFIQMKRGKIKSSKSLIYVILISFCFLEQSSLIQVLSKYGTCIIFDVTGYSILDPNLNCSDSHYQDFKHTFVYPSLFFWAIILPLLLGLLLYRSRHNIDDSSIRRRIGSLINNYKRSKYYWVLLLMATKLGLILVLSIVSDPRNATIVGVLIVALYYYFMSLSNPYPDTSLLQMDKVGGFTLVLSIIMFNQTINNKDEFFTVLYVISVFGTMLLTVIYMLIRIIRRMLELRSLDKKSKTVEDEDTNSMESGSYEDLKKFDAEMLDSINQS